MASSLDSSSEKTTTLRCDLISSTSPTHSVLSPDSACDLNLVHEELEKLNIATDVINKLELQLDEARNAFREVQSSWSQKLEQLSRKLGGCIEKSRPYYEARLKVVEAQQEAQRAALKYERANSMHAVAKQQVAMTQEGLSRQGAKNIDCLEVLNYHIQRVNEAETERLCSEQEHQKISKMVAEATSLTSRLERELSRSIRKSKAYFDARVQLTRVLDKQKSLIGRLEAEIKQKKADYNTSLRNLERISEQIHQRRGGIDAVVRPVVEPSTGGDDSSAPPSDPENGRDGVGQAGVARPANKLDVAAACNRRPSLFDPMAHKGSQLVHSGVILLAQELSHYDWLDDETRRRAFAFPASQHEDYVDLRYQTTPAGVKPFPSPPETPGAVDIMRRGSLATEGSELVSDRCYCANQQRETELHDHQPAIRRTTSPAGFLTVASTDESSSSSVAEIPCGHSLGDLAAGHSEETSSVSSFSSIMLNDDDVRRAIEEPLSFEPWLKPTEVEKDRTTDAKAVVSGAGNA